MKLLVNSGNVLSRLIPLRACGTRFIIHKVVALGRVVDGMGAYLCHLSGLVEDLSVKAVDRQRLKGYMLKWRNAKNFVGVCVFS